MNAVDDVVAMLGVEVLAVGRRAVGVLQFFNFFAVHVVIYGLICKQLCHDQLFLPITNTNTWQIKSAQIPFA